MSSIANDPGGGIAGRGLGNNLDSNFQSEGSQALAIKLDLKTKQHANSKALRKLIKAKGVCPTLKQAVQARAAIYGEVGEPKWFVRNTDISAKAGTSILRRSVRVQLAAAPLTVAQVGLQRLRTVLNSGDSSGLLKLSLGDQYTVAETLKMLSQVPPIAVLKLLNNVKAGEIDTQARIVEADLDFVQSVLDLVAANDSLKPSMNSVAEAFKRRLLYRRFASGEHSIKLDALVFAETKGERDFDRCASDIRKLVAAENSVAPTGRQKRICLDYQRGRCRWRNCRFDHRCSVCKKWGHGSLTCWLGDSSQETTRPTGGNSLRNRPCGDPNNAVPPNSRRRTDRPDRN